MQRVRAGVIAAAILAIATIVSAQKPDFSGTWTLDPASAPAGAGGAPLGNGPTTVKQTTDALTIEHTISGQTFTFAYKLDGSESRHLLVGQLGQPVDAMSIAKWDGATLTIVTKREEEGRLSESSQAWTVQGNTLTVETTNARSTQKWVYKK